jgi:hypothetical protein
MNEETDEKGEAGGGEEEAEDGDEEVGEVAEAVDA